MTYEELYVFIKLNFDKLELPVKAKDWLKVFNDMAVHTRKRIPKETLLAKRPNEDPEAYEYRLANYRPITYGSMSKAVNALFRIFNGINWSIEGSDDLKAYLKENNFDNNNFRYWIENIVLKRMIEDPNGLILWYPKGEGVINSSVKVEPIPKLIYSSQISYFTHELLIIATDETNITIDNTVTEGQIYDVFTLDSHYKLIVRKVDNYKILTPVYSYNLKKLPIVVLGGDMNAEQYYESFFAPYLAFGDEAITLFSDWQAVMTYCDFPAREEKIQPCENEGCYGGKIGEETCGVCKGTGWVQGRSPFGVYKIKPKTSLDTDESFNAKASLTYISPDVSHVKYTGESWKDLIIQAENALNISFIKDAQSGKAKEIDREDKYAMLTRIGNNIFDSIVFNSVDIIELLRSPNEYKRPVVLKPFDYSVRTESDCIADINELNKDNIPKIFAMDSSKELARKRFAGNPVALKIFDVVFEWDLLCIYSETEKQTMLISNSITKADYIKSIYSYPIVTKVSNELQNQFVETDNSAIIAKCDVYLKPYIIAAPTPLIPASGKTV